MFGVAFSELAILFSLVAALGLSPAGASSDKLEMAYVAPDECVFWLTWNGWKAPDPNSTNRTERLLAEESVKDFADQLNAEIDKLVGKIGAGNDDAPIALVLS